jgi:flagellin
MSGTTIANVNDLADALNVSIQAATLGGTATSDAFKAANIVASANLDGSITFSSSKAFQVNATAAGDGDLILKTAGGASFSYGEGTYRDTTNTLAYATLAAGETQDLTFTATGSDGLLQTVSVTLAATSTQAQAVAAINTALQASNLASLEEIIAVEDGAATVGFTSSKAFNVTIGDSTDANVTGFTAVGGTTLSAGAVSGETGATATIDTADSAKAAVTSLANAVTALGQAQANVGKGQNQFSYAINLASSQLTNLAAAESRIRDADLASEAANLTKAQTLLQAGIAALAQANSAPQAVLALLRG